MQNSNFKVCFMPFAAIVLFLAAVRVPMAAESDAGEFIRSLWGRAVAILQTPGGEKVERRPQFRSLFSEGFDLQTIGKFIPGRHWRSETPEQRKESGPVPRVHRRYLSLS